MLLQNTQETSFIKWLYIYMEIIKQFVIKMSGSFTAINYYYNNNNLSINSTSLLIYLDNHIIKKIINPAPPPP